MNCSQIESILPAYVDGASDAAQAALVERHLTTCDACRQSAAAQRAVRGVLGARRCLYGEGSAAHVLYRSHGQPISLFVLPGQSRERTAVSMLGHDQLVWNEGDRTYVLVGRNTEAGLLARMASSIWNEGE